MNDYYRTCPFPKPDNKKKKKKCNGYKEKKKRICAYCGEPFAERHELFGGTANRQISIDNGFQIDVCRYHHRQLQDNITDWAQQENKLLRSAAQKRYMDELVDNGMSEQDAWKVWKKMIGKNYREDFIPE